MYSGAKRGYCFVIAGVGVLLLGRKDVPSKQLARQKEGHHTASLQSRVVVFCCLLLRVTSLRSNKEADLDKGVKKGSQNRRICTKP